MVRSTLLLGVTDKRTPNEPTIGETNHMDLLRRRSAVVVIAICQMG